MVNKYDQNNQPHSLVSVKFASLALSLKWLFQSGLPQIFAISHSQIQNGCYLGKLLIPTADSF